MDHTFRISIADEKVKRDKDDPDLDNYDFTYEDVTRILDHAKNNPATDYWRASVRALLPEGKEKQIVEGMLSDIYRYYREVFSLDETSENHKICVRLFLNQKTGGEFGDAEKEEVRLFLERISGELGKKFGNGDLSVARLAVKPPYDNETDWFLDFFRYVLAHELFHAFHKDHYFNVNNSKMIYGIRKQGVDPETGADILLPDPNCVLLEVFAEYFACAYMHGYLDSVDPGKTETKWNILRANAGKIYFGFLQEEIIKKFNDGRIPDDLAVSVPAYWTEKGKPDPENNYLSILDYAGGFLMYDKALEFGAQGRNYPVYKECYDLVLRGKTGETISDEALYKVIALRKK